MTVFANKDAFHSLGTEAIQPNASHASQGCSVCTEPLAMHHIDASPKSILRGYHDAVRIITCGHTHGKDCLAAWLNVGNSCPTCNRILFELKGDPITQGDINNIVYMLGPMYGEARVNVAIVNLAQKQEQEQAALRRVHEQEVARQKAKDAKGFDEKFALNDEDWMDSDDNLDFEEGDLAEGFLDDGDVEDVEDVMDDVD